MFTPGTVRGFTRRDVRMCFCVLVQMRTLAPRVQ